VSGQHPRAWAAIDLLRFACAMLVVAHHYCAELPLSPHPVAAAVLSGTVLSAIWAPWTQFGWIGVELFFVISGYVIACSAVGNDPGTFLRHRMQRLLPAAWICATLSFVLLAAAGGGALDPLAAQWLRSMSFWPLGEGIDTSYWTLGIELAFYLAIAWRLRGGGSPERLERVAWWIGGASLLFWVALLAAGQVDQGWLKERLPQLLLLSYGAFFAIGMLLQAGHRDGFTPGRWAGLALFGIAAAIETVAHAMDNAPQLRLAPNFAAPLLILAAGIAVIALCRRLQPALARWSVPAALLGLMTYPLYLLHQPLGAVLAGAFGAGALWAGMAMSVALAWMIVRYAEPPLRAWIGSVLRPARRAALPA
jgi:peptidoglycan/LPS O-acetylase OafA/YrhL